MQYLQELRSKSEGNECIFVNIIKKEQRMCIHACMYKKAYRLTKYIYNVAEITFTTFTKLS